MMISEPSDIERTSLGRKPETRIFCTRRVLALGTALAFARLIQ